MHFFDWVLLLVPFFCLLFRRQFNQLINKRIFVTIFIILFTLQLVVSGYRWQMIPVYIIWGISIILLIKTTEKSISKIRRLLGIIGLIILLALAILPSMVFPIFQLPEPTGKYKVGTRDILIQTNREEPITEDPDDKRGFMVKAWYPSLTDEGSRDKYVDPAGRHGFAMKYGLPPTIFNYLDQIDTHSFKDAPIAEGMFPVLIFSHGYNSKANSYYTLITELVSHGYVVLAINHTYESTGTTMPDGSEVYFNYNYAQTIQENTWKDMEPVIQSFKEVAEFSKRHPIVKTGLETYFVKNIIDRWTHDISDLISETEDWNRDGFFKGSLNTKQLGVFGHSRGGGAAGNALLKDTRINAGINIDGVQWGDIVNSQFNKPFLFISADWPEEHEDLNSHAYINKSSQAFYDARIDDTAHSNFMDIPLMIPTRELSEAGTIDPYLGLEITNKLVLKFFDKYLKNKSLSMSTLPEEYEELQLEIFN